MMICGSAQNVDTPLKKTQHIDLVGFVHTIIGHILLGMTI